MRCVAGRARPTRAPRSAHDEMAHSRLKNVPTDLPIARRRPTGRVASAKTERSGAANHPFFSEFHLLGVALSKTAAVKTRALTSHLSRTRPMACPPGPSGHATKKTGSVSIAPGLQTVGSWPRLELPKQIVRARYFEPAALLNVQLFHRAVDNQH